MMLRKSGPKETLMPTVESMVSMGLLAGVSGMQSRPNDACALVGLGSRLHGVSPVNLYELSEEISVSYRWVDAGHHRVEAFIGDIQQTQSCL